MPHAFNTALGTAKQTSRQQTAAGLSQKLTNLGYTTAQGPAAPQQQYQKVKQNPAVQQLVKNLAAQWKTQGVAVTARIKQNQKSAVPEPTTESIRINNLATNDPAEQKLLQAVQKQELENQIGQLKSQMAQSQATAKANEKILTDLNSYSIEFQKWANTKLSNLGINMAQVEADTWAKQKLQDILKAIGSWGLVNPENPSSVAEIEEYFNVAIATAQALNRDKTPAVVSTSAGDQQQADMQLLTKLGFTPRSDFIESLSAAMRRAGSGNVIRPTGNEALNALARLAGFRVGQ